VNTYLGGEVTIRFVLKFISVLVVAAAVFGYYFYDLRRAKVLDTRMNRSLLGVASIAIIVLIVGAIALMGSPGEQRALRFDQQRISYLSNIQWQALNYWQSKNAFPQNLSELNDDFRGFVVPVDPQTAAPYEYRILSPLSFELCATFERSSKDPKLQPDPDYSETYSGLNENFIHAVGRTCFERTIDPELYRTVNPSGLDMQMMPPSMAVPVN
jgi:hypothetical protein